MKPYLVHHHLHHLWEQQINFVQSDCFLLWQSKWTMQEHFHRSVNWAQPPIDTSSTGNVPFCLRESFSPKIVFFHSEHTTLSHGRHWEQIFVQTLKWGIKWSSKHTVWPKIKCITRTNESVKPPNHKFVSSTRGWCFGLIPRRFLDSRLSLAGSLFLSVVTTDTAKEEAAYSAWQKHGLQTRFNWRFCKFFSILCICNESILRCFFVPKHRNLTCQWFTVHRKSHHKETFCVFPQTQCQSSETVIEWIWAFSSWKASFCRHWTKNIFGPQCPAVNHEADRCQLRREQFWCTCWAYKHQTELQHSSDRPNNGRNSSSSKEGIISLCYIHLQCSF